jgi:hypothetical protein
MRLDAHDRRDHDDSLMIAGQGHARGRRGGKAGETGAGAGRAVETGRVVATPVDQQGPVQRWWSQRQAPAGIFGTIIGASVIASADPNDPLHDVAWAVLVTLIVYWLSERWSEVLASNLRGEAITRRHIAAVFGQGWPMVQASYTPLVVLGLAWTFGASNSTALNLALGFCVATLAALGLLAGRRAGLSRWAVVGSGTFTAALGLVLIVLKAFLH